MTKINIKQPSGEEMPLEILADHIAQISKMAAKFDASRLRRRTICILVKDMTNLPMGDIERVLDALPLLEKRYLK